MLLIEIGAQRSHYSTLKTRQGWVGKMAKSIKERVEEDYEKAKKARTLRKLKEDYERYLALAAQPQISKAEIEHYKMLAAEALKGIDVMEKKK
jgi:multidrug resistance efflux pump